MASNQARVIVIYSSKSVRKKAIDIFLYSSYSCLSQLQTIFLEVAKRDGSIFKLGGFNETKSEDLIFYKRDDRLKENVEISGNDLVEEGDKFTVALNMPSFTDVSLSDITNGK